MAVKIPSSHSNEAFGSISSPPRFQQRLSDTSAGTSKHRALRETWVCPLDPEWNQLEVMSPSNCTENDRFCHSQLLLDAAKLQKSQSPFALKDPHVESVNHLEERLYTCLQRILLITVVVWAWMALKSLACAFSCMNNKNTDMSSLNIPQIRIHPVKLGDISGSDQGMLGQQDTVEFACMEFHNRMESPHIVDLNDEDWSNFSTPEHWSESNAFTCEHIGTVSHDDAKNLYQTFCPRWSSESAEEQDLDCDGDIIIPKVMLTCHNHKTLVFGGEFFPDGGLPTKMGSVVVFPTATNRKVPGGYSFAAQQVVPDPDGSSDTCLQVFAMKIYCQEDQGSSCEVIGVRQHNNEVRFCPGKLQLCPAAKLE